MSSLFVCNVCRSLERGIYTINKCSNDALHTYCASQGGSKSEQLRTLLSTQADKPRQQAGFLIEYMMKKETNNPDNFNQWNDPHRSLASLVRPLRIGLSQTTEGWCVDISSLTPGDAMMALAREVGLPAVPTAGAAGQGLFF